MRSDDYATTEACIRSVLRRVGELNDELAVTEASAQRLISERARVIDCLRKLVDSLDQTK